MKKILWVLLDSRMGSVGQARGVVNFLDTEKYENGKIALEASYQKRVERAEKEGE